VVSDIELLGASGGDDVEPGYWDGLDVHDKFFVDDVFADVMCHDCLLCSVESDEFDDDAVYSIAPDLAVCDVCGD